MKNIKKILLTIFTILIVTSNISLANNNQQPKPAEQKPQQNQQTQKEQPKPAETKKEDPKPVETPKEQPKQPETQKEAPKPIETIKETDKENVENNKKGNVTEVMKKDDIKMFGRTNRQFVSFNTSEGQSYYLLIDYDENGVEQNVEILKKISNEDISKIEQKKLPDPGESFEETKNENIKIQPELQEKNIVKNEKNNDEIKQQTKGKKEFNILDYAIYIVVIIVMIVILYLKKSKKNNSMEDNFNSEENYEENDEEMTEL